MNDESRAVAVVEAKDVRVGDLLVTESQVVRVEHVGTMWVHVQGWGDGTRWPLTDLLGKDNMPRVVRQPHELVRVIRREGGTDD
jgi:hypothetical protein